MNGSAGLAGTYSSLAQRGSRGKLGWTKKADGMSVLCSIPGLRKELFFRTTGKNDNGKKWERARLSVIRAAAPVHRTISECIAMAAAHEAETGQAPTLDADFNAEAKKWGQARLSLFLGKVGTCTAFPFSGEGRLALLRRRFLRSDLDELAEVHDAFRSRPSSDAGGLLWDEGLDDLDDLLLLSAWQLGDLLEDLADLAGRALGSFPCCGDRDQVICRCA